MSLTLDDVSYSYTRGYVEPVRALEHTNVSVSPGELVLVIGATGSGKSTLMRLAAGLLEPSSGAVTLDGEALRTGSAAGRIGIIFQDAESQLFADTLTDDVAFGPRNMGLSAGDARERAREALASVGLDPDVFGERSPFTLSGGEARRAAIAGVLAMNPSYVLADEPTAGLDARGRRAVRDLLLRQKQTAGVVVVSHAAEQFLGFADKLVILDSGSVAWTGDASEAVEDPDILAGCGMAVPEVLEVQHLVRACGYDLPLFSVDPDTVAEALLALGRR